MTDDEIKAEIRNLALRVMGHNAAFINVINALRAQSSFNQQEFEPYLAGYQVAAEQMANWDPVTRKAYQVTLASFSTKPPPVPPKLQAKFQGHPRG